MTSYEAVRETIERSSFSDWIRFPTLGAWTYQEDVSLRIEQHERLGVEQAPWTNAFQARSVRYGYAVYYGASPVEYHTIVGVDNDRAFVPEPRQPQAPGGNVSITPYQATIGEIVTGDPGTFESYCSRAGIVVKSR